MRSGSFAAWSGPCATATTARSSAPGSPSGRLGPGPARAFRHHRARSTGAVQVIARCPSWSEGRRGVSGASPGVDSAAELTGMALPRQYDHQGENRGSCPHRTRRNACSATSLTGALASLGSDTAADLSLSQAHQRRAECDLGMAVVGARGSERRITPPGTPAAQHRVRRAGLEGEPSDGRGIMLSTPARASWGPGARATRRFGPPGRTGRLAAL